MFSSLKCLTRLTSPGTSQWQIWEDYQVVKLPHCKTSGSIGGRFLLWYLSVRFVLLGGSELIGCDQSCSSDSLSIVTSAICMTEPLSLFWPHILMHLATQCSCPPGSSSTSLVWHSLLSAWNLAQCYTSMLYLNPLFSNSSADFSESIVQSLTLTLSKYLLNKGLKGSVEIYNIGSFKAKPSNLFLCKSAAKNEDIIPHRKYSWSLLMLTAWIRIVNPQENNEIYPLYTVERIFEYKRKNYLSFESKK